MSIFDSPHWSNVWGLILWTGTAEEAEQLLAETPAGIERRFLKEATFALRWATSRDRTPPHEWDEADEVWLHDLIETIQRSKRRYVPPTPEQAREALRRWELVKAKWLEEHSALTAQWGASPKKGQPGRYDYTTGRDEDRCKVCGKLQCRNDDHLFPETT